MCEREGGAGGAEKREVDGEQSMTGESIGGRSKLEQIRTFLWSEKVRTFQLPENRDGRDSPRLSRQ